MTNTELRGAIQARIDNKTKPPGSLGQLEALALQLAEIQGNGRVCETISVEKPLALVFAGDHGIARQGISIAPSEVTQQMVMNFLSGGAAINCFCRSAGIGIKVIDCGMIAPLTEPESLPLYEDYVEQRLGNGTGDISSQPAMSIEQVALGLDFGAKVVSQAVAQGSQVLMLGEMGIGNTSSSAALLAAFTGAPVESCVGRGTGIDSEQLRKKTDLISRAVRRVGEQSDPKALLAELGGFEIVQMTGAYLEAGRQNTPILVDGFIATVAALSAVRIEPECRRVMIFAHRSHESGHKLALEALQAEPLLDLGLRLGEGTGAALAFPLLKAAAEFYNNMATFDSAGVTV